MSPELYKFVKMWVLTVTLFGNICGALPSSNIKDAGNTNRFVNDHRLAAEKIKQKMNKIELKRKGKSYTLKVSLFVFEDRVRLMLCDADISADIMDVKRILEVMDGDSQKEEFISVWKMRNKAALELLEYWRQHLNEISDIPPTLIFSEKATRISDRQLYNALSENETLFKQYIQTPLAETNKLSFFLIDPAVYPKSSKKKRTELFGDGNMGSAIETGVDAIKRPE